MITSNSILYHELTGLNMEIIESNQKILTGIGGKIVFETKNMLHIRNNPAAKNDDGFKSIKKIPKKIIKRMRIFLENDVCFISGSSIIGRPEDRLNKK